nr:unnamed protein product [Digitaria exilis]
MLLMDSARRAGFSPVCLDLSVGLSPSPQKMAAETERPDPPASDCRMASSMSDEQAKTLEAKLTQISEDNRRLTETIAYLYASQIARQSPDDAPDSPPPPVSRKRRDSLEPSNSGDDANASSKAAHAVESSLSDEYEGTLWLDIMAALFFLEQVQRSAEDSSVLVATYEGEHNHPCPTRAGELPSCATRGGSVPCSISINSSGPTITLDLTKNGSGGVRVLEAAEEAPDAKRLCQEIASSPEFRTALVEQMARSLTRDSKFTDALAAAILKQLPDY